MKTFFETFNYNPDTSADIFRLMVFIRCFEQKLLEQFSLGKISGTTHTCIGQEANAVGIITTLDKKRDTIWSNHRCHGHFLAYCGDALSLFSEILGKEQGMCKGRGGSQHLAYKNFFSSGIQGGLAAIAVGAALADKDKGAISTVFLGDGTLGEGNVYEALNMASLWNAPVLFVVEDNGIAQTTERRLSIAGQIADRGESFNVRSRSLCTTDVLEIISAAEIATEYVREEGKPYWLHIETTRLMAHSKGDDTRSSEIVADLWKLDCLCKLELDPTLRNILEDETKIYINKAFELAAKWEDA